nr:unnamed protein product [Digitaria exilis]
MKFSQNQIDNYCRAPLPPLSRLPVFARPHRSRPPATARRRLPPLANLRVEPPKSTPRQTEPLTPSRANSGEGAAVRRREPLCSVNRGSGPVHGLVHRDVMPTSAFSRRLVAEPFEFANDPVLEEQLQQQFTEEGKYNTDHPCYLYTN